MGRGGCPVSPLALQCQPHVTPSWGSRPTLTNPQGQGAGKQGAGGGGVSWTYSAASPGTVTFLLAHPEPSFCHVPTKPWQTKSMSPPLDKAL